MRGALTALPNSNLVENIGYDQATHGMNRRRMAAGTAQALTFPLRHPPVVLRDIAADRFTQQNHFGTSLNRRVRRRLFSFFRYVRSLMPSLKELPRP